MDAFAAAIGERAWASFVHQRSFAWGAGFTLATSVPPERTPECRDALVGALLMYGDGVNPSAALAPVPMYVGQRRPTARGRVALFTTDTDGAAFTSGAADSLFSKLALAREAGRPAIPLHLRQLHRPQTVRALLTTHHSV